MIGGREIGGGGDWGKEVRGVEGIVESVLVIQCITIYNSLLSVC